MKGLPVAGYDNLYLITSEGRVFDILADDFCPSHLLRGYLQVRLIKDGRGRVFPIHRLVAEAYVPRVKGRNTVNHRNFIKTDNRADNLEWMTTQENKMHAVLQVMIKKHGSRHINRLFGSYGGQVRAQRLSPERRKEIARLGGLARQKKAHVGLDSSSSASPSA